MSHIANWLSIVIDLVSWEQMQIQNGNANVIWNDILLSRFDPPVAFNDTIYPVCLPEPGDEEQLELGMNCYATGEQNVTINKLTIFWCVSTDYNDWWLCTLTETETGTGTGNK